MDNITQLVTPEVKFEFVSMGGELVKAATGPDGKKMLHGVASSTTRDLHGDVITLSALQDMERTAVGMTIYLNHSYELPQDVGGTVTKAIIKQQGVDHDGEPNYSLLFDIEVEDENPAALQTWRYIQKGRKLGLSIGAMIPKGGAVRQKDGSYVIEHINLLETSLVGIPANPKSWVDYAASALRGLSKKEAKTTQLGSPTITLDGENYRIEGSLNGLDISNSGEPTSGPVVDYLFVADADGKTRFTRLAYDPDGVNAVSTVLGSWDLSDEDDKIAAVAMAGEVAVQKATVWVTTRDGDEITIGDPPSGTNSLSADAEPDTTKACPTCGKGKSSAGCSDAYHKNVDPDVTDAKIRVIEVDTDAPASGDGQGASSSEPDDADTLSAPEADVTAEAEPVILDELTGDELLKLSFGQVQAAALAAVAQLVETKRLLDEEKQARIAAERRLDEVEAAASELVQRTAEVIEKVAKSPLTRKAAMRDVESQFSSNVQAYYGEEFARALAGKS